MGIGHDAKVLFLISPPRNTNKANHSNNSVKFIEFMLGLVQKTLQEYISKDTFIKTKTL